MQVLATVDLKDALIQVPQPSALRVRLNNTSYAVLENLPGQRLGAKSWFWYFRCFLQEKFNLEFFQAQPCLCRNESCALATHVDDVMYFGCKRYWRDAFLPNFDADLLNQSKRQQHFFLETEDQMCGWWPWLDSWYQCHEVSEKV